VVDLLAAAATSVVAVSTAVGSVVLDTLQGELVLAEVESVLAGCAEADFAQLRTGMRALILPLEVSADQPVRSDTTTEAAARLLLGHTNSADGETNRRNRMPAGTHTLLASRIARRH
jgi:hypothetical protein